MVKSEEETCSSTHVVDHSGKHALLPPPTSLEPNPFTTLTHVNNHITARRRRGGAELHRRRAAGAHDGAAAGGRRARPVRPRAHLLPAARRQPADRLDAGGAAGVRQHGDRPDDEDRARGLPAAAALHGACERLHAGRRQRAAGVHHRPERGRGGRAHAPRGVHDQLGARGAGRPARAVPQGLEAGPAGQRDAQLCAAAARREFVPGGGGKAGGVERRSRLELC